jgi:hypothetical protein
MKIKLKNVRGAFLELFEAKTVNGEGDPAFSGAWLIDPNTPEGAENIRIVEEAEMAVAKEKWGAKGEAILAQIRKNNKAALNDGDLKASYAGYEGMKFVNSRSKTRPLILARKVPGDGGKTPITAVDGIAYSGAYYNTTLELWAQDNSYGKRINASLKGAQFFRDGDAFTGGGTPATEDDFEDLGDTGEDGNDLV